MLTFQYWSTFLKIIQYGGALIAMALNFLLLMLIVFRSPKHLGVYKYLMIYIAVFEFLYAIVDAVVEPNTFTSGPAFIVFRYFKHSYFGKNTGFYLITLYCATFGLSLALFGIHFIYRYGAADVAFRKKYLTGIKLKILFLMPIVYLVWWASVILILFRPSVKSDLFMRTRLLQGFDTRIEDVSYIYIIFHSLDPLNPNEYHPVWQTFCGMTCMWFMIYSSSFCMFYFGIKCYLKITRALKKSKMSSYYARSIQQQLFQALLMQTLIPIILMYAPIFVLFAFPMFNIEVGFISSFVTATIAIYPALDPLPTLFIVENYRKSILNCCRKENETPATKSGQSAEIQN